MVNSPTTIIAETQLHLRMLHNSIENVVRYITQTPNFILPNTNVYTDLLKSIYDAALSEHLHHESTRWPELENTLIDSVAQLGLSPNELRAGLDLLLTEIVDKVYAEVLAYIKSTFKNRWEICITAIVPVDSIAIQRMGDYRVLEWEKAVESGALQSPVKKPEAVVRPSKIRPSIKLPKQLPPGIGKVLSKTKPTFEPIGYIVHYGGKRFARSTLTQVEQVIGAVLPKEISLAIQAYGALPNNCVNFQTPYGNGVIEALWREDRVPEHFELKRQALALSQQPSATPLEIQATEAELQRARQMLNHFIGMKDRVSAKQSQTMVNSLTKQLADLLCQQEPQDESFR